MCKVIAVTDKKLVKEDFLKRIQKICESHVYAILLREKELTAAEYEELARQIIPMCEEYRVRLILHSHYDIARRLMHPYLHLPLPLLQELPEKKRKRFWMLGTSCHSLEEVKLAEKLGATYVTLSPVFATGCKPDAVPLGLAYLKQVTALTELPVLALGGVVPENAGSTLQNGAAGVCVRSSFMTVPDVKEYAGALRDSYTDRKKGGRKDEGNC